jgi:hypothetical protein
MSFLALGAVGVALLVSGAQQPLDPGQFIGVAPAGPSYGLASVQPGETVELRSAPDGPVVAKLGARTEFGSPRVFYVAERRGAWLGVPAAALPNGELGWIRDDPARLDLSTTPYSLHADLARRTVEIRYGDALVQRIPVTIGAAGTSTPSGTFSVTDGLAGRGVGPWYGCCILALTGHQANLPADWLGGNRIAIHGTPGVVGGAASHGCLRASDRDMVTLFALVPLGAPVFVRA